MQYHHLNCPKCGHMGTPDVEYVPRGDVRPFPGVQVLYLGSPHVAKGPTVMITCRVCRYTETRTPADGEGIGGNDASKD